MSYGCGNYNDDGSSTDSEYSDYQPRPRVTAAYIKSTLIGQKKLLTSDAEDQFKYAIISNFLYVLEPNIGILESVSKGTETVGIV